VDGGASDRGTQRRKVVLDLDGDLVARAEALGASLPELVERLLAKEVAVRTVGQAEIDAAVDRSNAFIAGHGSIADEHYDGRFG
jgi:post-segregation antitoxin (ccd killing protein)